VRFGRIPKQEKQRMLLEMQSAMNNMMNSSQALPLANAPIASAIKPASEEIGSAPSSSPCSSQSDSSSDPEAAVPMDTSCSSASPSASDSSEDEVIGSVTRAHQETFMYNQEHSSQAAETPRGPLNGDFTKTTTNQLSEEGQDTWNHCNNTVNVAGHSLLSILRHPLSKLDNASSQCPFKGARNAAAASHSPTYIHGAVRAPPTELCTGGVYSRGTWRGRSRMYLVRWSFTPAVREVVEFAKKIPGFRELSQHDQVSLLKSGTFEVLVVRFASLFNVKERSVTFLGGKKYSVDALRTMGSSDLLSSMFDFCEKLMNLGLSEEEMSLFTAETLIRALRSLITRNHANESAIFTKLLLKLPDLRSLNNMHSEQLLAFKVHS
ncbi:hypothetical protein XENOCAPTIV_025841, partial [Xenoophorus captivus]